MKNINTTLTILLLVLVVSCNTQTTTKENTVEKSDENTSNLAYLKSIKKIDVHMHIKSEQQYLIDFMDEWNFKFTTVSTVAPGYLMQGQIDTAKVLLNKYPRYYAWITTFDPSNFEKEGWAEIVIKQLKDDFNNGAIGVKVWKAIGMAYKKSNGKYLQLDDPVFNPIFEFIAKENKTLIAHMGEPIHAWMPTYTTKEGVGRNYWAKRPEYSFWDKPDLPSYSDILAARDHVIERNPNLRIVGAHLGSMEFDVDEIITRLEKYPNFAVELGGRTRYFMWQAKGKVQDFFNRYQDRIMYGTDRGSGISMTEEEKQDYSDGIRFRNDLFLKYYATSDNIPWGNIISSDRPKPNPTYTIQGINLSKEILDKFFYQNAIKWFPGIEKDY